MIIGIIIMITSATIFMIGVLKELLTVSIISCIVLAVGSFVYMFFEDRKENKIQKRLDELENQIKELSEMKEK